MFALSQEVDKTLSEFLKGNSLISAQQLDNVKKSINGSGAGIVPTLIDQKIISEEVIADKFAAMYGLKRVKIEPEMFKNRPLQDKVTDAYIKKNRVIPFRTSENSVTVVIADPGALNSVSGIKLLTGKSVETLVSTISPFEEYIKSLSSSDKPAVKNDAAVKISKPGVQEVAVRRSDRASDHESGSDIINYVDFVIEKSIMVGASDIHFEAFRHGARLRIRRDGVLQELDEKKDFLAHNYSAITTRIKIMANLNISERRLPQDGAIAYPMEKKTVDLRVSILPTAYGERVVMRILDPESANMTLDQLGLPEETLKKLRKAVHAPQGMVLVTGPTGSGKSTTLYAV